MTGFILLVSVANLISGFLRSNVSSTDVVFNFLIEFPFFLQKIIPVSCLVASLFSINKLKNRNELTAIFASGFSRKEYIFTLCQAAAIVSIIQFVNSGFIQPFAKANKHYLIQNSSQKFRNLKSKGLRANTLESGKIWYKTENYFFSFLSFSKKTNTINQVELYIVDKNYKLKEKIIAPKLLYKNGHWVAPSARLYNGLNNFSFPSSLNVENHVAPIEELPSDFTQIESDISTLSFFKLFSYIKSLESSGINTDEYKVLFLDKISAALICFVFTLLAAIAVFNPNRRNSSFGPNITLVFVFTLLYWLVHSYTTELGVNSILNPYISTFSVPFIFTLVLAYFFIRHKDLK